MRGTSLSFLNKTRLFRMPDVMSDLRQFDRDMNDRFAIAGKAEFLIGGGRGLSTEVKFASRTTGLIPGAPKDFFIFSMLPIFIYGTALLKIIKKQCKNPNNVDRALLSSYP